MTEWDAVTYDRISDPQARWGRAVLDRLTLAGDEVVLDAGCGSGRVTEALLERLPRGKVVAVDASAAMVTEAGRRLARFADRVELVTADLAQPLPLAEEVDAIVSTATFHWIHDHPALFANLAGVLRPGGRLAAQCGGLGNVASVYRAVQELGGRTDYTYFTTPEVAAAQLKAAGFTGISTWLVPEPTSFPSDPALEGFLASVVLRLQMAELADEESRAQFLHAVVSRLPSREIDYVRLNIDATLREP